MKKTLLTCAAVVALFGGTASASAQESSSRLLMRQASMNASVNAGTAQGQRAVAVASKRALAMVAADSDFNTIASRRFSNTAAQRTILTSSQQLRVRLMSSTAALSSTASTLTPAERRASASALQNAYRSAVTSNAVTASGENTISYKGADGSMQNVSFVMSPTAAAVVTAGTSAVSLTGLSASWKRQVAADHIAVKNANDAFYMRAFSQVLLADRMGCNAFTGYHTTDGLTTPTFSPSGCR